MKTVVYAIARNESNKVEEWYDRVKEADKVLVLVNNSTDDTAEKLRKLGAEVVERDYPFFRFDIARNDSLDLVPQDAKICLCIDIDELLEYGWREKVEKAWVDKDILNYKLVTHRDKDGNELCSFNTPKIHSRTGWKWTHACHEILEWTKSRPVKKGYVDIRAVHNQDGTKERSSYLDLLELDVKENPKDGRAWHYLGREYMFKKRWAESIAALMTHLSCGTWQEERCASMRYIARGHYQLGNTLQSKLWLYHACGECTVREPYVDMAWVLSQEEDWAGVKHFAGTALKIHGKGGYPSEASAWGELPQKLYDTAVEKLRE